MNQLTVEQRVRVAAALADGVSMRGVERLTGATRKTVGSLLLRLGDGCALLHASMMRDLTADVIECDEVWAFVGVKEGHRGERHPEEFGDAYTYVAIDATSRTVISHLTDKRTTAAATAFTRDIRARVLGRPQITTDGLLSYEAAIEDAFGTRVHYAKNLKTYALDESGGASRDDVRYSRGRCVASQKVTMVGSPDPARVTTAHVERNNLTSRMWCRRLTRLTTCFSRRLVFLRSAMAWHFAVYNFVRVSAALRVTPAMQLGVTDHVWSMEELVTAALEAPRGEPPAVPPPTPPSTAAEAGAVIRAERRRERRQTARSHERAEHAMREAREPRATAAAPTWSQGRFDLAGEREPIADENEREGRDDGAGGIAPRELPEPPDAASDFRWMW
ncbi:MAG: DDE-type integrase/transposase/recombinase [Polyangiales bacterium]